MIGHRPHLAAGEVVEKTPTVIQNGDPAAVILRARGALSIEQPDEIPAPRGFAIRKIGRTVAAGGLSVKQR